MLFAEPDYPHVVMAFAYRGFTLELDQGEDNGVTIFSVWATHAQGCAVAVPAVYSRREAIVKARAWVDKRLDSPTALA